jgi:hypothetical protein
VRPSSFPPPSLAPNKKRWGAEDPTVHGTQAQEEALLSAEHGTYPGHYCDLIPSTHDLGHTAPGGPLALPTNFQEIHFPYGREAASRVASWWNPGTPTLLCGANPRNLSGKILKSQHY